MLFGTGRSLTICDMLQASATTLLVQAHLVLLKLQDTILYDLGLLKTLC